MIDELLARCPFPPPGTSVDCAFSGGADSTALVVLAAAARCRVTAVHVDHGLRPSSADEAEQARHLAGVIGVGFRLERLVVAAGPNLEARARAARSAVLPSGVLTGHTADDRAETMLINLLRGTGLDGLAAMGPDPARPLLALRRSDTAGLCAVLGLPTVDDPTNAEPRFVRNRVRHELLPLMASIAGRDVIPLLVRTAEVVADDLALADAHTGDVDPTDAKALAAAPPALARRVLRRWLLADGYPPDAATVARVLAVARGEHRACELTGGRRVERHRQRLRILSSGPLQSQDGMTIATPGSPEGPGGK
ncbi:MAG: tRNA lysidine(34) synthetase TilS [Ilumatobacteraceae bacterium]